MPNKIQVRGRPLSDEVMHLVHQAALALVAESGLEHVSRSQIAARAGVSRQTLYNRWQTVGDIVLEALLRRGEREIGLRDGDMAESSAADELPAYVEGLAAALNSWAAPGLKAVAALAQRDAAFAERFRRRFIEPRRQRLAEVVRAICADSDKDAAMLTELILASMWYRLLITGQSLDQRWIDNMLALCLGGATRA